MYVLVMGAGTVGLPLISSIVSTGHEVLAIEPNRQNADTVRSKLGSIVIDATSSRTLQKTGAARADIFIATTGNDADNLSACLLAKNMFKVKRTVSIVNLQENAELFEQAGVDIIVSTTDLVIANLAGALPAHPLVRLMPIRGRGLEIVGIKVPEGAIVVGKPLRDLQVPYGVHMNLIISSAGRTEDPKDDTIIEAEDEIIAVSPVESTQALWETLTELR
ncbi:MAG: TrkA family potassium uptake protein [Chloroflexi bacterium]|nr:TrkA family potassium uptake protein [Chloroflexota bacterium]